MSFSILDCTLRDGGYYNNWDFDSDVVDAYLKAVANAGIEYVELGLRSFPKEGFLGAFAYTTEEYINSIVLPEGPVYGVMVDAKTILESGLEISGAVDKLFVPAVKSKLRLVRVAAHFHEVEKSGGIVRRLKELGYQVGFNFMQAGGKPNEVIAEKAREVACWEGVDVLYFADSLGNMDGSEVRRVIGALREHWSGPIGIHTHNNMGKGIDNTLTAKDAGVLWLDATISGMGRGAGNTQTEMLLSVLCKNGAKYNAKPIYELVIRYFEAMQKSYGWGCGLLYFLAAQNEVHPTYIQNLLSNSHYGTDEIIGAIDYLSKLSDTASFSGAVLDNALSFSVKNREVSGSHHVAGLFDNKNVLVITNAPNTKRHAASIEQYIRRENPVVISINIVEHISQDLIDFYVISHNSKFLSDSKKYQRLSKPVILPKCRFSKGEIEELAGVNFIDYGIEIDASKLKASGYYTVVPHDTTSAYVLGILLESNAKGICVVGFDGYDQNDLRQQEMVELLNIYNSIPGSVPITALTPTPYPIKRGSIYAQSLAI